MNERTWGFSLQTFCVGSVHRLLSRKAPHQDIKNPKDGNKLTDADRSRGLFLLLLSSLLPFFLSALVLFLLLLSGILIQQLFCCSSSDDWPPSDVSGSFNEPLMWLKASQSMEVVSSAETLQMRTTPPPPPPYLD